VAGSLPMLASKFRPPAYTFLDNDHLVIQLPP
jgi:hypothetical protein